MSDVTDGPNQNSKPRSDGEDSSCPDARVSSKACASGSPAETFASSPEAGTDAPTEAELERRKRLAAEAA
jgi:hypothetical protein